MHPLLSLTLHPRSWSLGWEQATGPAFFALTLGPLTLSLLLVESAT